MSPTISIVSLRDHYKNWSRYMNDCSLEKHKKIVVGGQSTLKIAGLKLNVKIHLLQRNQNCTYWSKTPVPSDTLKLQ